jgi:hypothetical protein
MVILIGVGIGLLFLAVSYYAKTAVVTLRGPRLGILNLAGAQADGLIASDRDALRDVFQECEEYVDGLPRCDVLFVYANFSKEGYIQGYPRKLREIIRDAGAQIVVVASENSPDSSSAWASTPYGRANLVITFDRHGTSFPRFFRDLFLKMKTGSTMPLAWVQLAPQSPRNGSFELPSMIFLCEAGRIRFK